MNFPFELKLRIDWSEMDIYGHVNNVMYAKYIQSARIQIAEKLGIIEMWQTERIGFMLAASSLQFKKSLLYPGNITIRSKISFIKNSSFGILHEIIDQNGEISALAEDVIVMFDFNSNQKVNISEALKEQLHQFSGI